MDFGSLVGAHPRGRAELVLLFTDQLAVLPAEVLPAEYVPL